MTSSIAVIGDVMIDITSRLRGTIVLESDTEARNAVHFGGAAANVAVGLAHLGADVTLMGCVGQDAIGQLCVDQLTNRGVQTRIRRSQSRATGTCIVLIDSRGERSMLSDSGANRDLVIEPDQLADFQHVHVSGYAMQYPDCATSVHRALRNDPDATLSIDIASISVIRAHRTALISMVDRADIVFGTEVEFAELHGERLPSSIWVQKDGPHGVAVHGPLATLHAPAPPISVTDTTGAGDAFAAGFLFGWLPERDLDAALTAAQSAAAAALTRVGAWPVDGNAAK